MWTLLLFLMQTFYYGYSEIDHDYGSWNSVTLVKPFNKNQVVSLEHEVRYSDEIGNLSQEQFKALYIISFISGDLGFGSNYRTENSYNTNTEKRYLVQWESLVFNNKKTSYSSRVRFELRDFVVGEKFAQRFRWRNSFDFKTKKLNGWVPTASSEFNIYLNQTSLNTRGFYSHRAILSVGKVYGSYGLSFKFVNDYKKEPFGETMRNAAGFDLTYVFGA